MTTSLSSQDQALGALVGLVVGDALGAPVEFKRRGQFPLVEDMIGGGKFRLPPGAWTDDTAMALCLAESLLAHPELDRSDLMSRFLRWIDQGENSSTGRAVGLGQNTLWALADFRKTGELIAKLRARPAHSNGALMRLAPLPCMHWRHPERARRLASLQSWTTHHSALSSDACVFVTTLMCALIRGATWDEAKSEAKSEGLSEEWAPELAALVNRDLSAIPSEEISSSGYVIHTLEAAMWSVETTQSFEAALIKAVNLGDDADTVGAVTGQLAGALYGLRAIPQRWLEPLVEAPRIKDLGDQLFHALATADL